MCVSFRFRKVLTGKTWKFGSPNISSLFLIVYPLTPPLYNPSPQITYRFESQETGAGALLHRKAQHRQAGALPASSHLAVERALILDGTDSVLWEPERLSRHSRKSYPPPSCDRWLRPFWNRIFLHARNPDSDMTLSLSTALYRRRTEFWVILQQCA